MKIVANNEKCYICGKVSNFIIKNDATLLREAKCERCGASLRNSDLAKAIVYYLTGEHESLDTGLPHIAGYRLLNTCSSGSLHEKLSELPGYQASEYFDDIPNGEYKDDVISINLMNIPLYSNSLDVIISEDVFEHISDYKKAFKEIHRVLKPGGYHFFTIPFHEGRKTINRTGLSNKVWHGDPIRKNGALVYTDFGEDLIWYLRCQNYKVKKIVSHRFYDRRDITSVDNEYEEYLKKIDRMDEFFKYNSVVFVCQKKKNIFERIEQLNPSAELVNRYYESKAISGFDARNDDSAPQGCYQIEGDGENKYVWASEDVNFTIKISENASCVTIDGFVPADMYKLENSNFYLDICFIDQPESCMKRFVLDEGGFSIQIPLPQKTPADYFMLSMKASDYVCRYEDGTGPDKRHLSWILHSITLM